MDRHRHFRLRNIPLAPCVDPAWDPPKGLISVLGFAPQNGPQNQSKSIKTDSLDFQLLKSVGKRVGKCSCLPEFMGQEKSTCASLAQVLFERPIKEARSLLRVAIQHKKLAGSPKYVPLCFWTLPVPSDGVYGPIKF